jgi:uncharacterized protein (DUF58 family)/transglutaminase-like putative cysteine protease
VSEAARPAVTPRGWAALACGLAALVLGRLFGSAEVALLGGALIAAVLLARVWVGRAGGPHIAVRSLPPFAHAGETVSVALELRSLEGARSGRAAFVEGGGGPACALRSVSVGDMRVLRGSYELGPLARGVRELGAGLLVREDPFGLARRADSTRGRTALTVVGRPLELPDIRAADRGEVALARQRLRSGGHELHGVREHQPGESLRGVHWPATAHHGRLMVKELDDPAGDELAVVLDARTSADVGTSPDSSFELAVAAAGQLVAQAHADGRHVRLIVAGPDGAPASAGEGTAARRLLATVRPDGERSPGELLARLAAGRIEVVTSRPAALVGALRSRQLGVVAIDPSSFDVAVPRDAEAIAALRAAGCRVLELRRPEPEPVVASAPPPRRAVALRGALYALACAFGLLHARDLQAPALSTPRLAAIVVLASAPALVAVRAGRRLGLLALAPAALVASYLAADRWPSPGEPLGGLAGRLWDAPGAWVQVVLPFGGGEHPELRAAVLMAVFAWLAALAWFWLARPRPLLAALLATLPFALSATVYDLPQYPWRALFAGLLLFAFLRTGRAAGGGLALAAAFAALALTAGMGWAALPAASRPALLPWTTWTFSHASPRAATSVDLVWDMRYRPLSYPSKPVEVLQVRAPRASYWRAVVLAGFDGLRFTREPQSVADATVNGDLRVVEAPAGPRLRADVRVEALSERYLVAPGQPVRYQVPLTAGPAYLGEDGTAFLSDAPAPGLTYVSSGAAPDPTARALGALPAGYPAAIIGHDLRFADDVVPPFGGEGRAQEMAALFRAHAGDPAWSAWQVAYAKASDITRGAASPYQAVVALEAWLRTSRVYDQHASLPERPDALARWAASGRAGYCQMFAASLAALVRLSGVPARVAEGFAPGDRRAGVFHVSDRDAHAWVEVWFPGYGWLPFDATPGRDLPARASSSSAAFDGRAAQAPPRGSAPAGSPLQLPLAQLQAVLATRRPGETAAGSSWGGTPYALALAIAAALLAALIGLERALLRLALPREPARAARGRVEAFAADQRVELSRALTPRELGAVLAERFGVEADRFAAALERSAYAAPAPESPSVLATETAALLRALRAEVGPAHRLRGVFSLKGLKPVLSAARARAR